MAGSQEWSITGDGLWDFASTLGPTNLYPHHQSGVRLGIRMSVTDADGDEISGYKYFQGYSYLTSWSLSGPLNQASAYAFTFEGDGELTMGTAT